MDRIKVREFNKDLAVAVREVAKKHGFADVKMGSLNYNDVSLRGSFTVYASGESKQKEESTYLPAGLNLHDKITVFGFSHEYEVVGATPRGSIIVDNYGKRYRIGPNVKWTKVGEKAEGLTPPLIEEFADVAAAMSPENLSCDGELSHSATVVRYRNLQRKWKSLELRAGRKVTEEEIWNAVEAKQKVG